MAEEPLVTAAHEVGHAVVAVRNGFHVRQVCLSGHTQIDYFAPKEDQEAATCLEAEELQEKVRDAYEACKGRGQDSSTSRGLDSIVRWAQDPVRIAREAVSEMTERLQRRNRGTDESYDPLFEVLEHGEDPGRAAQKYLEEQAKAQRLVRCLLPWVRSLHPLAKSGGPELLWVSSEPLEGLMPVFTGGADPFYGLGLHRLLYALTKADKRLRQSFYDTLLYRLVDELPSGGKGPLAGCEGVPAELMQLARKPLELRRIDVCLAGWAAVEALGYSILPDGVGKDIQDACEVLGKEVLGHGTAVLIATRPFGYYSELDPQWRGPRDTTWGLRVLTRLLGPPAKRGASSTTRIPTYEKLDEEAMARVLTTRKDYVREFYFGTRKARRSLKRAAEMLAAEGTVSFPSLTELLASSKPRRAEASGGTKKREPGRAGPTSRAFDSTKVVRCPKCQALYPRGDERCPTCGARPPC